MFSQEFGGISANSLIVHQRGLSDLRNVPLMSDVDRSVEMNATSGSFTSREEVDSPHNVWPNFERAINQAAAATDLVTIFGEMLQLLKTSEPEKMVWNCSKETWRDIQKNMTGPTSLTKELTH